MKKLTILLALMLGITSMAFAQEASLTSETSADAVITPEFVDPALDADTSVQVNADAFVDANATTETNSTATNDNFVDPALDADSRVTAGVEAQSGVAVILDPRVETFVRTYAENNTEVDDVSVTTDGKASMMVQDSGRLFGLFPVTVNKKVYVMIDSNNEVDVQVKKPWWAFLVAGEAYADIESQLEADIQASLNGNV